MLFTVLQLITHSAMTVAIAEGMVLRGLNVRHSMEIGSDFKDDLSVFSDVLIEIVGSLGLIALVDRSNRPF